MTGSRLRHGNNAICFRVEMRRRLLVLLFACLFLLCLIGLLPRADVLARVFSGGKEIPHSSSQSSQTTAEGDELGEGGKAATAPVNSPREEALVDHNQRVLREGMRRDSQGLTLEEHADGRRSVHLQGRFQHMSVAFRGEGDQLIKRCYHTYDAMMQAGEGDAQ